VRRALLALTVPELFRLWSDTWRIRYENPRVRDDTLAEGPAVLAFWHGEQMAMIRAHAHRGFVGLASRSLDGELLTQVIARFGYEVVRGSSSRGGPAAIRQCIRVLERGGSPALAIDGPRGPRHVPHPGVVGLAMRTGRPILFGVARPSRAWTVRSWDGFEIPLPGAEIVIRYGVLPAPAEIEPGLAELASRMEALGASTSTGSTSPGSTRG
jgi:lysophospholipid acyltransferase (LPLAT)-like uncharacterized protein